MFFVTTNNGIIWGKNSKGKFVKIVLSYHAIYGVIKLLVTS